MYTNIQVLSRTRKAITTTVTTAVARPRSTSKLASTQSHYSTAASSTSRRTSSSYLINRTVKARSNIWSSDAHTFITRNIPTRNMSNDDSVPSTSADATSAVKAKHTNRLANEKSPYLLQHAHNPVNWYPWCEEAIQQARAENKLIFLSVGYSTCHWCHVMEHESFENEEVAALMNKYFINIKVDREERPDIDKIYMQFVLMLNGSGGWPMSVWLTPDLAPITAGTYFPPNDRWGMPSFTNVIKTIASKWESNREELKETGKHVINAIQKSLSEKQTETVFEPGSADGKLQEALRIFKQRYDQEYGGFTMQPKFPEVSRLNFLFHAYIVTRDEDTLDMALQTLHHIGHGGIHDHVFGGFARYSVDRFWHVPHFEKMLYDQGQLLAAYANAYKLTQDSAFIRYAEGIYRYLVKDLRHPKGGFYSGEDADSLPNADAEQKIEGAFYAWTWAEVKEAVISNSSLYVDSGIDPSLAFYIYASHFDLRETGNIAPKSDPHGHLTGKNIQIVRGSLAETCEKFDLTKPQLLDLLSTVNEILHKIRDKRPRPHLDTKIICAWNGLVLSGLAKLANCGGDKSEEYLKTATGLYKFIRKYLFDAERKVLRRACYGLDTKDVTLSFNTGDIGGFLDDYAFLIKGLLDYYKASLDGAVLQWAKELQEIQDTLFWDNRHGAYFYSMENASNVVVRLKEDHDGAEPCGNSISARNLVLLSHYLDDSTYKDRAQKLFEFFADVNPFGYTLPEMLSAFLLHEHGLDLVAVVGTDSDTTKEFVQICRKFYVPGMIMLHVDPQSPDLTYNKRVQEKFKMVNGKTTVYICHDRVCRMPVTDPVKLEETLKERFFKCIT